MHPNSGSWRRNASFVWQKAQPFSVKEKFKNSSLIIWVCSKKRFKGHFGINAGFIWDSFHILLFWENTLCYQKITSHISLSKISMGWLQKEWNWLWFSWSLNYLFGGFMDEIWMIILCKEQVKVNDHVECIGVQRDPFYLTTKD